MNNVCHGCGSVYQSLNTDSPGYIKKEKMNDAKYCERCFKIIHYGKTLIVDVPADIDKIIETVNKDDNHSLFLIDLLSLNEDIVKTFNKINYPKTLVISKTDIFRNIIKPARIKEYITKHYGIKDNIIFISSKNHETQDLLDYLNKNKIFKAYLLGFVNAGKSSLLNEILNINSQKIIGLTTSYIPHTTMNFINIKINDKLTLIDSPGFSYPIFLNNNIDLLKKMDINKKLKPITYQMKPRESLKIDDLVLLTFLNKSGATIYMSNKFVSKKEYKVNRKHVNYHVPANSDLVIKGIGFINIKNESDLEVDFIDESMLEIRPSIFGG